MGVIGFVHRHREVKIGKYLLNDGKGGVVDASLVKLTEKEKDKNSWQRATL